MLQVNEYASIFRKEEVEEQELIEKVVKNEGTKDHFEVNSHNGGELSK